MQAALFLMTRNASNLDVLRAIAVLLVTADHSMKFFGAPLEAVHPVGVAGVYLFFVHTCCVLMMSLDRQEQAGRRSALSFYLRRFFRVYPLSICFVLLVTLFHIPAKYIAGAGRIAHQNADPATLWANLTLTMNITGADPIMGQLWSLPLEVEMYILLPALFLFARRRGTRGILALWCISVAAASAWLRFSEAAPGIWRLSLIRYVPCFLPGIAAYSLLSAQPRWSSAMWPVTVVALCAMYVISGGEQFAGWLLCFIVGVTLPFFQEMRCRWVTVPAAYVAKYSYGIYLSHVLALWLAFSLFQGPAWEQAAIWIVCLCAIPALAYHAIESPFISVGQKIGTALKNAPAVKV